MEIKVDSKDLIHILWSHGDAIPNEPKTEIATILAKSMSSSQLRMECRQFVYKHYNKIITENNERLDEEAERTYNKIIGYRKKVDSQMSKYADLAKG